MTTHLSLSKLAFISIYEYKYVTQSLKELTFMPSLRTYKTNEFLILVTMKRLLYGINIFLISIMFLAGSWLLAQETEFSYICPLPGSVYVNPEQTIILKTGSPFDLRMLDGSFFSMSGTKSGNHTISTIVSEDGMTLIVKPSRLFSYGETVTFSTKEGLNTASGQPIAPFSLTFHIKEYDNRPLLKAFKEREFTRENEEMTLNYQGNPNRIPRVARDNNLPSDFPQITTIPYGYTGEDYYFIAQNDRGGGGKGYANYLTICDRYGTPVYFKRMDEIYLNFFKLPDGKLAYARNSFSYPETEKYFLMDSSYHVIDSIRTGNGYDLDCHDLLLLNNGHYLVMSYDPQIVNMGLIVPGGKPNATVVGLIIQEVDNLENVYFQWRSWDHFEITDATSDINLTGYFIDYVHCNAIDLAADGNILLSSRNMDEITKISYSTGDIIWRFGPMAENNEFTINNDPDGFTHQHDIRVLPNGNITIFDNGNLRLPNYSQAKEYQINEISKVATRVWSYRHNPDIYASVTGSHRRYNNGISLIGWGGSWPVAGTEINLYGTIMLELFLPDTITSYRCLKYPWKTNRFSSLDYLHLGNVSPDGDAEQAVLPVTNHSNQAITINSYHTLSDTFLITTPLPLIIPAGTTRDLVISFEPMAHGEFEDILTLNYDNYNLTSKERIAIQTKLSGTADTTLPVVTFDPEFNATEVDPNEEITVYFSEPVRQEGGAEILDDDIPDLFNFQYKDQLGDPVPFSGYISSDKKTVTITPLSPLLISVQYYVEMKADTLEDFQGNVLNYPEATVFTTGNYVTTSDITGHSDILIYPSPFREYIQILNTDTEICRVQIFDITSTEILDIESQGNSIEIPTGELAPGIYLIKVYTHGGKTSYSYKALKY